MHSLPQAAPEPPAEPDKLQIALSLLSAHADARDETLERLRRAEYSLIVGARREGATEWDIADALRVSRTPVRATFVEAEARGDLERKSRAPRRARSIYAAGE